MNQLGVIRYQTIYEPNYLNALAERSLINEPVGEFSCVVILSRNSVLAEHSELTNRDLTCCTEVLYGDASIPALPVNQARELAQAIEAKNTITVYERASQLELISRLDSAYAISSPAPQDVLDRFGLVQRKIDFPGNVYRDVLIYRAGYHLSRLDRLLFEKLRESAQRVIPE